jgi:hypothetical protein
MIGHREIIESVMGVLKKDDTSKAWLFTGPSGIGKTTIARVLAKEFGATQSGIIERNTADIRGIDGVRNLIKQSLFKSPGSPVTVIILDECHQLTTEAQNAILKALEDTPKHVYYILCTTEPEKLLETVRQRCLQYKFGALIPEETELLLYTVIEKEALTVTEDTVHAIIERSNGSPRLALNMLEKVGPVGNDYASVLTLIDGMAQNATAEGPVNIGLSLLELMYGRQKCQWAKLAKFLTDRVLQKKEDIAGVKRALIYQLGKKILYLPDPWLARAAIRLEENLFGANTEGGFTALLYELWKESPVPAAQTTNSEHSVGNNNLPPQKKITEKRTDIL